MSACTSDGDGSGPNDAGDSTNPSDEADEADEACTDLCTTSGFSSGSAEAYDHEVNCTCEGDDSNEITSADCTRACADLGWSGGDAYAANACQCSGATDEPSEPEPGADDDETGPVASPGGGNGISAEESDLMLTVTSGTESVPEGDYGLMVEGTGAGAQRTGEEVFVNFGAAASELPDGVFVPDRDSRIALRFQGLNGVGTFDCGERVKQDDDLALPITLSLGITAPESSSSYAWNVDGSSCTLTITAFGSEGIEATFEAKLYDTSLDTPDEFVAFTGSFSAPDAR